MIGLKPNLKDLYDTVSSICRNDDSKTVYLFSSGSRAIYAEDIYNSLAYPPGFVIQFRYRKQWLPDDIDPENPSKLEQKDAVIVACPKAREVVYDGIDHPHKGSEYYYYPLRKGKITKAVFRGGALHVFCELSSRLITYDSGEDDGRSDEPDDKTVWNVGNKITELKDRPRYSEEEKSNDSFISLGSDLDLQFSSKTDNRLQSWKDQEDNWVRIVQALGKNPFFEETLFFRITNLYVLTENSANNILQTLRNLIDTSPRSPTFPETCAIYPGSDSPKGYIVDSLGQYRIELSLLYAGSVPDDAQDKILQIHSGRSLQTSPDRETMGFSTDTIGLNINPNSVYTDTYSDVTIDVESIASPQVDIPLIIRSNYLNKYGLFAVIVFGIFLSLSSKPLAGFLLPYTIEITETGKENLGTIITILGLGITTTGLRFYNPK
ncbi:hypothetical protein [Natrinema hispanicum]|uniref:hypothetical protein n=1 Tax=Natrinema hispanicum TaxID=392421 RepID=UPI00122CB758|nr:hypothetical protein [Natrinema hispanicum]